MSHNYKRRTRTQRGSALLTTFMVMTLLAIAGASFIGSATSSLRIANRQQYDIVTTHVCEAGVQAELRGLWRNFKTTQQFVDFDIALAGASAQNPRAAVAGTLPGAGSYSAAVISSTALDPNARLVTVRSVGWVDRNGNGVLDRSEPRKVVDVIARYTLVRSKVFDYTYFVNNYGWMDGFGPSDLIINGDMRANGNFNFLHGSPTVNGSVYASLNEKLLPGAAGVINGPPLKWSTDQYASQAAMNPRWRQAYDASIYGAKGSAKYRQNRDLAFDSDASMIEGRVAGAALLDATGTRAWQRESLTETQTEFLDQQATRELSMPDLSDLNRYVALSANYTDSKQAYRDGTPNPNFGQGAYVDVWDATANAYKRVTTGGVVKGSAALIGTVAHPIKIHGPVTFTQDVAIKGNVSGQGTIYTGRNVHIVGSIRYTNTPDFRGADANAIDNVNEKKDMLGLAARGSVIMGDPSTFTSSYPLQYMTPPFTHDRLDESGHLIPAYNALQADETGFRKYQSVLGDAYLHSIAEGVNQIDGIIYTDFVGGGNLGTSGKGIEINGTIISKDEAMVAFSLPMRMNYDNRVRERTPSKAPLIDISLPRSPLLWRASWQERAFSMGSY
jgi:hypothetical protein